MDLRDRPHRASRTGYALILVDAQGGLQSADRIDVRGFQLVHELTSEAREALKVLTLAFSEEGVERERAFSASAYAGKHRQFAMWNV